MTQKLYIIYFFASSLALMPIITLGTTTKTSDDQYASIFDSFTIAGLVDTIRKLNNLPEKSGETDNILKSLPLDSESLENTIKGKTPDLESVNRGVEEETGINVIKFFGWLKKIFSAIFGGVKEIISWMEN